jgi:5-methylcytosine-specific restriction endonuclease McrA
MKNRQYIIAKEYTVHEVFVAIKNNQKVFNYANLNNLRIQNFFLHGTTCVCCGKCGNVFKVERTPGSKYNKYSQWHLNLYAADGMLMTADHIVPKSRGGKTEISNLQPMCSHCNMKKGNRMPNDPITEVKCKVKKKRKWRKVVQPDIKHIDFGRLFSPRWLCKAIRFAFKYRIMPGLPHKKVRNEEQN